MNYGALLCDNCLTTLKRCARCQKNAFVFTPLPHLSSTLKKCEAMLKSVANMPEVPTYKSHLPEDIGPVRLDYLLIKHMLNISPPKNPKSQKDPQAAL